MKFKLICEHEEGDVITHEFNKVFLSDVVERMQDFLKGCGFVFDGTLDIVEEEQEIVESDIGSIRVKHEDKIDPFDLPNDEYR